MENKNITSSITRGQIPTVDAHGDDLGKDMLGRKLKCITFETDLSTNQVKAT